MEKQITRIGVYGVVINDDKILLIQQKKGPYVGKLDFPGGGMEFGESPEQTLRREFAEEVALEFDSMQLIDNVTATIALESYTFFHVGLIYKITGYRPIHTLQEFEHIWIDPKLLSEDNCSSLLWKYKQRHIDA